MIRLLIILYLSLSSITFVQSKEQWFDVTRLIKSENISDKEKAIKWLLDEKNITTELINSLEKNIHASEALLVCKTLKRGDLYPNILQHVERYPSGRAIMALVEMSSFDKEKKLPKLIHFFATKKWEKLDARSKVATLSSVLKLGLILPFDKLKNILLLEESDQLKIASTQIAGSLFRSSNDVAYAEIIKTALHLKPYQLRVEALYAIEDLDDNRIKNIFGEELKKCINDENVDVRMLCKNINEIKI